MTFSTCPSHKFHTCLELTTYVKSKNNASDRCKEYISEILMLKLLFWIVRLIFMDRTNMLRENMALRQQLAVQNRNINRPYLRSVTRNVIFPKKRKIEFPT